jgi:hypothetical protein
MSEAGSTPDKPGWYPHPERDGELGLWDGRQWVPLTVPKPSPAFSGPTSPIPVAAPVKATAIPVKSTPKKRTRTSDTVAAVIMLAIGLTIAGLIAFGSPGKHQGISSEHPKTVDYRTERCSDFLRLSPDEQSRQAFEVLAILRQGDVPQSEVAPSPGLANRYLAALRAGCDTPQDLTVGDTAAALMVLDPTYDR